MYIGTELTLLVSAGVRDDSGVEVTSHTRISGVVAL